MPEWLTHVLFAWLLFELISLKFKLKKKYLAVILIGAILPDIEKVFAFFFSDNLIASYPSLQFISAHGIMHTSMILLFGIFIASFWKKDFKISASFVSIGILSHLFLDTMSTGTGIMWLWPLSWERFGLSLYWSDWLMLPLVMLFWLGLLKFLKGEFNFVVKK